jgi:hypothetical protein
MLGADGQCEARELWTERLAAEVANPLGSFAPIRRTRGCIDNGSGPASRIKRIHSKSIRSLKMTAAIFSIQLPRSVLGKIVLNPELLKWVTFVVEKSSCTRSKN